MGGKKPILEKQLYKWMIELSKEVLKDCVGFKIRDRPYRNKCKYGPSITNSILSSSPNSLCASIWEEEKKWRKNKGI